LDKKLRTQVQLELKDLHRRLGLTFIYVTHDQEEALSMSDRIAVLRDGRVIQHGTPTELYVQPRTRFVADFLGASNFLSARVVAATARGFAYTCGDEHFEHEGSTAQSGDEVVLALRPEKIELVREPDRPRNRVAGTIVNWSYIGTSYHLLIKTAVTSPLAVNVPTWRHGAAPDIGGPAMIAWDPDATVLVQSD
jgi:putative spermidine/putrescine transport system ATP-binding protein